MPSGGTGRGCRGLCGGWGRVESPSSTQPLLPHNHPCLLAGWRGDWGCCYVVVVWFREVVWRFCCGLYALMMFVVVRLWVEILIWWGLKVWEEYLVVVGKLLWVVQHECELNMRWILKKLNEDYILLIVAYWDLIVGYWDLVVGYWECKVGYWE